MSRGDDGGGGGGAAATRWGEVRAVAVAATQGAPQ